MKLSNNPETLIQTIIDIKKKHKTYSLEAEISDPLNKVFYKVLKKLELLQYIIKKKAKEIDCNRCKGSGYLKEKRFVNSDSISDAWDNSFQTYEGDCEKCNGTGKITIEEIDIFKDNKQVTKVFLCKSYRGIAMIK